MEKIIFLILNYKNVEETEKCIESIDNSISEKWRAVIVDNGSSDDSYERLTKLYSERSEIEIILSENNLGFSKGNNLGYKYIRDNYKPQYVIVTNNDVLFEDSKMVNKLDDIYSETGFYVYGPDIYVRKNKEHQSPLRLTMPSVEDIQKELEMFENYMKQPQKWAKHRKFQIIKNKVCQSSRIIQKIYNKLRRLDDIDKRKRYENPCVQGACIIVSERFLQEEEKMFSPEPFLYCEELFLMKKCLDNKYSIIYDPRIQVIHEDSSTMKKLNSNDVERAIFTLKHHVLARKMLIEYMKQV